MIDKIDIIPYFDEYSAIFKDLNIQWLESYFFVEPNDELVLGNPKKYILEKGGYIFFAKLDNEIVGTFALMNESECYELSKMAVNPKYQGKKIGQKLLEFCISFSKEKGWDKIMLYSSKKLEPAIHLYKKFGFLEVELEKDVHYQRADIKMMLNL